MQRMIEQKDPDGLEESTRLEARIARLEAIARRLEREDLELDDALALFEEGVGHLREARQLLSHAELRIERLIRDLDGQPIVEPLDSAAER
jgi:exodeoxyribonuclease VII small subunit